MKHKTRNKIYIFISILLISASGLLLNDTFAQRGKRGEYGTNPVGILDKIAGDANDTTAGYKVQDTALDGVDAGPGKYRIHNTLDRIRKNISPYMQWMVYIGLTAAVILLIYNGFLLSTGALHEAGKREKVRGNIMNIAIGVLILTWFYAIFRLTIAVINAVFGAGTPWI